MPTPFLPVVATTVVLEAVLLPATVVTVAIDPWPTATVVAVTGTEVVAPVATGTVVTVVVPVSCTVVVEATVVVETAGEVIVIEVATASDVGPVFDAASNTEPDSKRRVTVPSEVHVTEILTVTFAVPAAGVAAHPVAVPVKEKSPATIPDTTSENVNV
jgi:hypothetical protein